MINYSLLKCAFGRHKFGELLHDDMLDRWVKVCRICGAIIEVDAPRDESGDPYDPHDWLRMVNDRDEKTLSQLIDDTFECQTKTKEQMRYRGIEDVYENI